MSFSFPLMFTERNQGFTLIEVLSAIILVGLVSTFVITKIGGVKERAYVDAMKNDLHNMAISQEQYFDGSKRYVHPSTLLQKDEFSYSEDVATDSVDVSSPKDWWFVRVRHNKTDIKCELLYRSQDEVDGVAQRIVCPGAGTASNENQEPVADFTVSSSSTSGDVSLLEDSWLLGDASLLGDGTESFNTGGFEPNVDLIFDASDSYDPDGDPLTYEWVFGGEEGITVEKTSGADVEVTNRYFTTGNYSVTLTVSDDHGGASATSDTSKTLVINRKPTADFTADTNPSYVDEQVCYTNHSSDPDGDAITSRWNFGGEGTSSETNPCFTYSRTGSFTVSLTIEDENGATDQASLSQVVEEPPNQAPSVSFSYTPTNPDIDETVQFTEDANDPDGTIASYYWGFEGEGSSTDANPTRSFSSNGLKEVCLTATDNEGASAESCQDLQVGNLSPVCDFSWTPNVPEPNEEVQFTEDASDPDGTIETYAWDFDGDGINDATDPNPIHIYENIEGTFESFNVRLEVADNDGKETSCVQSLVVDSTYADTTTNTPPEADFDYSPVEPDVDEEVSFTDKSSDPDGTIEAWSWNFGGDGTSTEQHPVHTFPSAQCWSVSLTVTDDDGLTDQAVKDVCVGNQKPNVDFNFSTSGLTANFQEAASDPDGWITTYEWDFTDDGTVDATEANPSYEYPSSGIYDVRLTVADNDGATASIVRSVPVDTEGPVASFSYSPSTPMTLDEVSFDASSSTGQSHPIASYSWTLGDSTDTVGVAPNHVYADDGDYLVELTVVDTAGITATATKTVSVGNRTPNGNLVITFPGDTADVGEPISFVADHAHDPDGSIASWTLTYGDGTEASGAGSGLDSLPDHTYDSDGQYEVCLTLTDDDGASTLVCNNFTVGLGGPTAYFSWTPSNPAPGETVKLWNTSVSAAAITSVSWRFDDGSVATGDTVTHSFSSEGDHPVEMTVTDTEGATSSITNTLTAIDVGEPTVTLSPNPVVVDRTLTAEVDSSWVSSPGDWSYEWNWGDGSTSTGQIADHAYSTVGSFTIVMTATHKTAGYKKSTSVTATVDPALNAVFDYTPSSPTTEDTVTFDGSASSGNIFSYEWAFDYSVQDYGQTYESLLGSGDTDVRLIIRHISSAADTTVQTVTVSAPMTANFTASPNPVGVQDTLLLDSSESSGSTIEEVLYQVDNGGVWETVEVGFVGDVERLVPENDSLVDVGDNDFRMIAQNHDGSVADTSEVVTVNVEDRNVDFTLTDLNGGNLLAGDSVRLEAEVTGGGEADTYSWDAHDATWMNMNSSNGDPAWMVAEDYWEVVDLTVDFTDGSQLGADQNVSVGSEPTAEYSITDLNGGDLVAGDTIELSVSSPEGASINDDEVWWGIHDGSYNYSLDATGNPVQHVVAESDSVIEVQGQFEASTVSINANCQYNDSLDCLSVSP